VLVVEGAGSPAEINLHASDIANMRVAREAGAAVLLVSDIDRGGSFAHLFGTHQLLSDAERALIRGFVLNRFRGDAALLPPGPQMLEALTGVPTIGVLPWVRDHGLPQEDGVFDPPVRAAAGDRSVAVVAYPRISNLDEFAPLSAVPGMCLHWARDPRAVEGAELLILPGSKHVADDLRWLHDSGMAAAVRRHAAADKPLLAVCGGLQMLGHDVRDPHGVEGAGQGLGLMPWSTQFEPDKIQRRSTHTLRGTSGFWAGLDGVGFDAYEIRHGRSTLLAGAEPHEVLPLGAGWQLGNTLALYTHGLFENTAVLQALFGHSAGGLERCFDALADLVDAHLDTALLRALAR
jgi:adenosylcobyric acid synthase